MGRCERVEGTEEQRVHYSAGCSSHPQGEQGSEWRRRQSWKPNSSVSWGVMAGGSTQWSQTCKVAAQLNGISTEDVGDSEQWCRTGDKEQEAITPLLTLRCAQYKIINCHT